MVIGAYIVTSYFIFVEKHPETKKEDIYGAIEDTIGKKHALKKYDQFVLNTSCFV